MEVNIFFAYLSGLACSLCYGISTVLQQTGVKHQDNIGSLNVNNAYKLFQQLPYVVGIILDLFGWLFFLYSARQLPLFLCLSFVSFSLVITAIIAKIYKNIRISNTEQVSLFLIFIGLIILGVMAQPSEAGKVGHLFKTILILFPIPMALFGLKYLKDEKNKYSALVLAALAGLTYGATGIISRIVNFHNLRLHNILQALVVSIAAYGILGTFFLAAALQRENVNRINSVMYSFELAVPSILGLVFLGDKVRHNYWPIMLIGLILVVSGSILIAYDTKTNKSSLKPST
jgi:hypothetical protein